MITVYYREPSYINFLKISTLITLLSVVCLFSKAQSKSKSATTVISGVIYDKLASGTQINIEYYKNFSTLWEGRYNTTFKLKLENRGFKLQTSEIAEIGYVEIIVNNLRNKSAYPLSIPYLIEPGDKISLRVRNNIPIFYGNRAEKYNLVYLLNKIRRKTFQSSLQGDAFYTGEMKQLDSLYSVKLAILNRYKKSLTKNAYEILKLNLKSEKLYSKISFCGRAVFFGFSEKYKILELFNKFIKPDMIPEVDRFIALKSYNYADCLSEGELFKAFFLVNDIKGPASYIKQFHLIISNWNGPIRDKLLAIRFSIPPTFPDSVSAFRDLALTLVRKTSDFYPIISDNKNHSEKGAKVFDFYLIDSLGIGYGLKDFRNKIVVMDFYYNGCLPCARLAKAMTPVIEKYKYNPDVIFVSISVDNKRKLFTEAVKKGIYTHPQSLDLWTGEAAMNHELIKFYGYQGCPQLLLINKNSKILFENPIRPSLNKKTGEIDPNDPGVIQMIKIIEDGLTEKNKV